MISLVVCSMKPVTIYESSLLTSIQENIVTCSISEGIVSAEIETSSSVGCWVCDSWRCWNINGDNLCVSTGIIDSDEPVTGWSSKLDKCNQTCMLRTCSITCMHHYLILYYMCCRINSARQSGMFLYASSAATFFINTIYILCFTTIKWLYACQHRK